MVRNFPFSLRLSIVIVCEDLLIGEYEVFCFDNTSK